MGKLDPVTNFGKALVSGGYNAAATAITLQTGEGAKFPDPASLGAFNVTWWNSTDYADPSDDPNKEIVRVTARTGDNLTVTRGQDGTSASTKNTASKTYKMLLGISKKMIDDLQTELQNASAQYQGTDSGAADAYAIALSPAPTAYAAGQCFRFKAANTNTGNSTLNVNGLGAKTIKKIAGAALKAGDIAANDIVEVVYDGVDFRMIGARAYDIQGICKAWVSFNGTGTLAVNASYNVSSVTDNGTGDYTINFTTAFATANYAMASSRDVQTGATRSVAPPIDVHTKATTSCQILTHNNTPTATDFEVVDCVFFGAQ